MSDLIAAIATGSTATAIGIVRVSGDRLLCRLRPGLSSPERSPLRPAALSQDGVRRNAGRFRRRHRSGISRPLRRRTQLYRGGLRRIPLPRLSRSSPRPCSPLSLPPEPGRPRPVNSPSRAFLNGKMDLTEAEAVIDLIDAQSAAAAKNAAAQLDGGLRRRLEPVQEALIDITSRFYAVVDYPDEDIEDIQPQQIRSSLQIAADTLSALLDTAQRGRVLKNGVRTAIVGLPNAGKSSLLNALAGYDRAIVTDIPGTTRDTVEETVTCGGTLLRLIDTAGIHDTADAVEQLGVERSRKAAETADLVIAVVDGSQTPPTVDEDILSLSAQAPHWILAVSKNDLNPAAKTAVWQLPKELRDPDAFVSFSSVAPGGLDLLVDAVQSCFPAGTPADAGSLLTNARQESAVRRSLEAVRRALSALDSGLTPDAVLTDAEEALESIGELTGRTAKEEIVGAVFSRFCVGK